MPRMIPDHDHHMVINLGDPHRYIDQTGNRIEPRRSHINANHTHYVTMERSGRVEIIGVVFKPHGFYPFIQIPLHELSGHILNMDDLMADRLELLEEQLVSMPSVEDKCKVLERWLIERFRRLVQPKVEVRREIIWAGERIRSVGGTIRIRELASELDLGERTLERYFKTCYGVSPKQYADLQRVHHVLRHMKDLATPMSDYVILGDYYDQAHFTRVFKSVVGLTPRVYMQQRDLLSDLYNTSCEKHDTITSK